MTTVLDPPKPKTKPESRRKFDPDYVCHLLPDEWAPGEKNVSLCGEPAAFGVVASERRDRDGKCRDCHAWRCPKCMEFVE